jgi:hypothetical protein
MPQQPPSDAVLSYLFDQTSHASGVAALVQKYPQIQDRVSEVVTIEASIVFGDITIMFDRNGETPDEHPPNRQSKLAGFWKSTMNVWH